MLSPLLPCFFSLLLTTVSQESGWVDFTVTPHDAAVIYEIDNVRVGYLGKPVPIEPGHHIICIRRIGYRELCATKMIEAGKSYTIEATLQWLFPGSNFSYHNIPKQMQSTGRWLSVELAVGTVWQEQSLQKVVFGEFGRLTIYSPIPYIPIKLEFLPLSYAYAFDEQAKELEFLRTTLGLGAYFAVSHVIASVSWAGNLQGRLSDNTGNPLRFHWSLGGDLIFLLNQHWGISLRYAHHFSKIQNNQASLGVAKFFK